MAHGATVPHPLRSVGSPVPRRAAEPRARGDATEPVEGDARQERAGLLGASVRDAGPLSAGRKKHRSEPSAARRARWRLLPNLRSEGGREGAPNPSGSAVYRGGMDDALTVGADAVLPQTAGGAAGIRPYGARLRAVHHTRPPRGAVHDECTAGRTRGQRFNPACVPRALIRRPAQPGWRAPYLPAHPRPASSPGRPGRR